MNFYLSNSLSRIHPDAELLQKSLILLWNARDDLFHGFFHLPYRGSPPLNLEKILLNPTKTS
jgi:hypothetical protein